MKFSLRINQYAAVRLGLMIDLTDLLVFDVITSAKEVCKGCCVATTPFILEQLPLLGISSRQGVLNKVKHLVDAGVLVGVGSSVYKLTEIGQLLLTTDNSVVDNYVDNLSTRVDNVNESGQCQHRLTESYQREWTASTRVDTHPPQLTDVSTTVDYNIYNNNNIYNYNNNKEKEKKEKFERMLPLIDKIRNSQAQDEDYIALCRVGGIESEINEDDMKEAWQRYNMVAGTLNAFENESIKKQGSSHPRIKTFADIAAKRRIAIKYVKEHEYNHQT